MCIRDATYAREEVDTMDLADKAKPPESADAADTAGEDDW